MAVPALAAKGDARSERASAAQNDEDRAAKAEAKDKDNGKKKGQASQAAAAKSSSKGKSASAAKSSNASAQGQKASAAKSSNASSSSKGDSSSASAAKATGAEKSGTAQKQDKAEKRDKAGKQDKAETRAAGENSPAGNKGSMKVRPVGTEAHPPRNYAHLPCVVQVDFYGSPHSGATLTAVSHAPTAPTGQTLLTETMTFSQSSPNPRGNELVGTTTLDFTSVVSGLTYHEQQGYHVKLTAEQDGPQGANVKHKVFWIDCPPPAAAVEDAEVGSAGKTQNDTTTAGVDAQVEVEREVVGQVQGLSGQERTEVQGVTVERSEAVAAVDGRVLGASGAVPAVAGSNARALAATGLGLLTLALVGLFGLGGGAGLLRRFRKR